MSGSYVGSGVLHGTSVVYTNDDVTDDGEASTEDVEAMITDEHMDGLVSRLLDLSGFAVWITSHLSDF